MGYKPNIKGVNLTFNQLINIIPSFCKGILIGIGLGAILFSLLIFMVTLKSTDSINGGALLALGAGVLCLYLGFAKKRS